jgi:hypothetical protein
MVAETAGAAGRWCGVMAAEGSVKQKVSSNLDQALELESRGFWVIATYPEGYKTGDGKVKTVKQPIGREWGLEPRDAQWLRSIFQKYPGAGVGICFGPNRGPAEEWLADLEGDGDLAAGSLATLLDGEVLTTMGWLSNRGGECGHNVFTVDGERLLAALAAAGATEGKGPAAGVFKLPELPDLEFRVGGFKEDGTAKQCQSVVPPTPGTSGVPRTWKNPPSVGVLPLPECAYRFLEGIPETGRPTNGHAVSNGSTNGHTSHDPFESAVTGIENRAARYLERIDPAIEGSGGSQPTFRAACVMARFGLSKDVALRLLMTHYNPRCEPPWSEAEMRHKVDDAYKSEPNHGSMTDSDKPKRPRKSGSSARAEVPNDGGIYGQNGKRVSCLHNSLLWLNDNGYGTSVRYDKFRQVVMIEGAPLDDVQVIKINSRIEATERSPWALEHVRSALMQVANANAYSSQTEWLESLKWDGTERIDSFFTQAYKVPKSEYSSATANVFFVSAVARAIKPGCKADTMVVLIGPQGAGKSSGVAALCPYEDWYADDLGCDLFDRKAGEGLRGKWLIEFSEFSRINRATLDVAKAFISRKSDYYRPAYGRTHKDFPRTCIFVGTTNNDTPLQDRENRRFMPIECGQADLEWIRANRDQLWAESVRRFKAGKSWWVDVHTLGAELAAEVKQRAEDARQVDAWVDIIGTEMANYTTLNMRQVAAELKIDLGRLDRSTQTRIGMALSELGYTKRRVRDNGERCHEWTK